jgi:hypothetical protein
MTDIAFRSNTACEEPGFAARLATSENRAEPSFVVIGAGKCGTTSLQHYLDQHPLAGAPLTKEVHFFDHNFHHGMPWYRAHFPLSSELPPGGMTGEATPYYLAHPLVPGRIASTHLAPKFVVMLRDPVDRAYSQYHMAVHEYAVEPLSFEEAVDREEDRLAGEEQRLTEDPEYFSFNHLFYSYLRRGCYASQLRRWFDVFDRDRFLVVQAEAFFADPGAVYAQVLDFLGLPPYRPPVFSVENGRAYEPMAAATRARLERHFEQANADLASLLGVSWPWLGRSNS